MQGFCTNPPLLPVSCKSLEERSDSLWQTQHLCFPALNNLSLPSMAEQLEMGMLGISHSSWMHGFAGLRENIKCSQWTEIKYLQGIPLNKTRLQHRFLKDLNTYKERNLSSVLEIENCVSLLSSPRAPQARPCLCNKHKPFLKRRTRPLTLWNVPNKRTEVLQIMISSTVQIQCWHAKRVTKSTSSWNSAAWLG